MLHRREPMLVLSISGENRFIENARSLCLDAIPGARPVPTFAGNTLESRLGKADGPEKPERGAPGANHSDCSLKCKRRSNGRRCWLRALREARKREFPTDKGTGGDTTEGSALETPDGGRRSFTKI